MGPRPKLRTGRGICVPVAGFKGAGRGQPDACRQDHDSAGPAQPSRAVQEAPAQAQRRTCLAAAARPKVCAIQVITKLRHTCLAAAARPKVCAISSDHQIVSHLSRCRRLAQGMRHFRDHQVASRLCCRRRLGQGMRLFRLPQLTSRPQGLQAAAWLALVTAG